MCVMRTASFKKRLEEEKGELESRMSSVGRLNPEVPDDWEPVPTETGLEADLVDQADVTVSRESNTAILADLEARYDNILLALKNIEKGTYGKCEVCSNKIDEARLNADPSASTCREHLGA